MIILVVETGPALVKLLEQRQELALPQDAALDERRREARAAQRRLLLGETDLLRRGKVAPHREVRQPAVSLVVPSHPERAR